MRFSGGEKAIVLGVLAAGPLHGYEIARKIESISQQTLRMGEGKLYPVLHELEEKGWVTAEWVPQAGKPARRVYSLTEEGRGELERQKKSWAKFAGGVGSILGGPMPVTEGGNG